jgi:hypothetical protein
MAQSGFRSLHESAIQLEDLDHYEPVFGVTNEDLRKIMLDRDPTAANTRSKLEHLAECLKTDLVAGLPRVEEGDNYEARRRVYPYFSNFNFCFFWHLLLSLT